MDPLHLNENNPQTLDGTRNTTRLDELRILSNRSLSVEDKVERLSALRESKTTRRAAARRAARFPHLASRTFHDRVSTADQIYARGWGIRLD